MTDTTKSGISRRTLAKGAAWAAPAVAVAAAAPMVAASPIVTVSEAGDACKLPGNSCGAAGYSKGYLQPLLICNSSTQSVTITITQPAYLTINGEPKEFTPVPASFTLAPAVGGVPNCQPVVLNLNLQPNSRQSSIYGTLNWTFVAADSQSGTGSTTIETAVTPPCKDCRPTTATEAAAARSAEETTTTTTTEKAPAQEETTTTTTTVAVTTSTTTEAPAETTSEATTTETAGADA